MTEIAGKLPIFISWSQPLAKEVATALRAWIPRVIQDVDPWMSSEDIEAGKFGSQAIFESLNQSTVGIIIVTPANLDRQWLNFEAGSLTRTINTHDGVVMPLLINMRGSSATGPISELQVKRFDDKDEVFNILEAINRRTRSPLTQAALRDEFDLKWSMLEEQVNAAIAKASIAEPEANKQPEPLDSSVILEQVVATLRDLRQDIRSLEPLSLRPSVTDSDLILAPILEILDYERVRDFSINIDEVTRGGAVYVHLSLESPVAEDVYERIRDGILAVPRYVLPDGSAGKNVILGRKID